MEIFKRRDLIGKRIPINYRDASIKSESCAAITLVGSLFHRKYALPAMKSFLIILITAVVFLLPLLYKKSLSRNAAVTSSKERNVIPELTKCKFQNGDIILRSGKGFISDVFRQFSLHDKKYSHAGIISIEQNKIFVYHITGGKSNHENELKKELIDSFCNEKENTSFGVYRYDFTAVEKERMVTNMQTFSKKKIVFDSHFDLATDTAMYCTELVYKVVEAATGNRQFLRCTIVDGTKFIAPDNLYLNQHAKMIY
ncbi:MAG: YiiX/YebB-like N1pC/P60 family cysteine hydrolase [Bacteroidia bacterium]